MGSHRFGAAQRYDQAVCVRHRHIDRFVLTRIEARSYICDVVPQQLGLYG